MSALNEVWARFMSLFRRDALDRDFDEEAQSHLDLAVEDYVRRGTPEAEARRLARMKFGAVEASKDAHRDSRGLAWLEGIFYDLRFACRGFRRDWAFSLAAVAMLALAIGLNVTVFTVMDAMLFRGFPLVKGNERLVYLQKGSPTGGGSLPYPDFEEWRAQAQTFQGMALLGGGGRITFRAGHGRPLEMPSPRVSANTFGLLGVPPMLGRDFAPADELPGAAPVAILNYRFWESWFDKRADIVGLTVQINGAPATIVGVMPEGFDFPMRHDLWMPVTRTPGLQQRGGATDGVAAVGRLRDGVSLQRARAELDTINRRLEAVYPLANREVVVTVRTYARFFVGVDAPIIYGSLWAAAWFVFLIACANLANLTLARTMGRWREFSTRIALGAGQGRMIRQMAIESLLLAGVAGALGWWITNWSVRTWAHATASIYQVLDYRVDSGTLAYLVAISIVAALLFSLAPIVRVVQLGVKGGLKGDARGVTQGLRGKHLAAGLVAGQMALAIVLLAGAGILGRSLVNIVGADTGVRDPERVLVGAMRVPSDKYQSPEARLAYFDRLDARLKSIPGIEEASLASSIPVNAGNMRALEIEGRPSQSTDERVQLLSVGSNYFRVVGVSTVAGRDLNDGDGAAGLPVAIVNQSFAATFWPGEQPLGMRLRTNNRNQVSEWRTVVGVVPNIMQGDALRQRFMPLVYVPFRQEPTAPATMSGGIGFRGASFLLRTRGSPDQVAQAVRAEVQTLDSDVLLQDFGTLKDSFGFDRGRMDLAHAELGKNGAVAPILAVIALLLAAIGLYAVIAHSVSQRTKEIGVRMAIGATAHDIRGLIFGEGMRPVALGLVVGLAVSLAVNRMLQSQLVGVSPYDPVTLATAPAVLILVALLACQIPSQRALRVDPAVVLRNE